jgi:WD40 repeat protein
MRYASWSICLVVMTVSVSLGGQPRLRTTLKGHEHCVTCITFSPDGKLLASSGWGASVRLWDVAGERETSVLYQGSYHCDSLAFSRDGKILAGGSECREIWLWDVTAREKTGTITTTTFGAGPSSSPVAFRPDGKTLASWSCDEVCDNQSITFWDVTTRTKIGTTKMNIGRCLHIAFNADAQTMAASGFEEHGLVKLYDLATARNIATLKGNGHSATNLTFSLDGKTFAAAIDGVVRVWDVATGKNTLTLKGCAGVVMGVAFNPDGKILASGSVYHSAIELWDAASGKSIATISRDSNIDDGICCLSFSPDGKMLAAGRCDCMIDLWDIPAEYQTGTVREGATGCASVGRSPNQ